MSFNHKQIFFGRISYLLFLLCSGLLFTVSTFAWPPTYGIELTFTNDKLLSESDDPRVRGGKESLLFQAKWVKEIKIQCPDCKIIAISEKKNPTYYKVTYPNGWWYNINLDPGVVEIQAQPFTWDQLSNSALGKTIDEDIFQLAKKIGLTPHENIGGGHIHIGALSAFNTNSKLLRNFFVDSQNNAEVFNGILSKDSGNAPTLIDQSWQQRKGFQKALDIFDKHLKVNKVKSHSANSLFSDLVRKYAYYKNSASLAGEYTERYQSLNLNRISNHQSFKKGERTLEIRALRPQRNIEELKLIVKLFEAKLNKLKDINTSIPFERNHFLNLFATQQGSVDMYYQYVMDLDLNWEEYKQLLPLDLKDYVPTPLKKSWCEWLTFGFYSP